MKIIETNLQFNSNMAERKTTKRGIFHNSGTAVRQAIDIIHNYHKNTRGYAGIGYHFYIRRDGSIYRGRKENMQGAHAYGANSDSIGICFEGNLDEEYLTKEQIEAGRWLVSYLTNKYGNIEFIEHRKVCNTSCPGKNFNIDEIVNATVGKNETVQTIKSIDEIAQEVINNKWDVQPRRRQLLEQAGYNYEEVQARVNEILLGKKTTVNRKNNEQIANEVIEGKWSNGQDRKIKLAQAGYDYNAIQKIVNKKSR